MEFFVLCVFDVSYFFCRSRNNVQNNSVFICHLFIAFILIIVRLKFFYVCFFGSINKSHRINCVYIRKLCNAIYCWVELSLQCNAIYCWIALLLQYNAIYCWVALLLLCNAICCSVALLLQCSATCCSVAILFLQFTATFAIQCVLTLKKHTKHTLLIASLCQERVKRISRLHNLQNK